MKNPVRSTVTVVQRRDERNVHPRLIRLADRINQIRQDFPPHSCQPLEISAAILQTAISLESINFDVMQTVVSELTDATVSFALFTSHGAAIASALDLAEDIWSDLPITFTLPPDVSDETQPVTVPPFVPTVHAFSQE